jgi:hypothetical protein
VHYRGTGFTAAPHVERRNLNLARYPLLVIRFKVAENFFLRLAILMLVDFLLSDRGSYNKSEEVER